MPVRIARLDRFLAGWAAYFALAETPSVFDELDEWLRRRLRQVRWKEWKRPARGAATSWRSVSPSGRPASGRPVARATGGSRGPHPPARPAQRLLDRPRSGPAGHAHCSSQGTLANRRMRTRTSGGVGGAGVTPAPTRFVGDGSRRPTSPRRVHLLPGPHAQPGGAASQIVLIGIHIGIHSDTIDPTGRLRSIPWGDLSSSCTLRMTSGPDAFLRPATSRPMLTDTAPWFPETPI